MKLVLSRKGFDSSSGGCPSPIFPDGSMVALPIPDRQSRITYRDLTFDEVNLATLVRDLTGDRRYLKGTAHLDPDLEESSLPRLWGWRPLLGQTGAAQTHLSNQGVGSGDLFLFFGLFRPVEFHRSRWRFVPKSSSVHAIWGWLQVGEVQTVDELADDDLPWAAYHPHFCRPPDPRNTLYVARNSLVLNGRTTDLPAAGAFRQLRPELRLTAPRATRTSQWRLPASLFPSRGRKALTYHGNHSRWRRSGNHCYLDAVGRGQEFVLDTIEYEGAVEWIEALVRNRN